MSEQHSDHGAALCETIEWMAKAFFIHSWVFQLLVDVQDRLSCTHSIIGWVSFSLRLLFVKLFAWVNLARTEYLHKFVFGLKKEICDYLILQQPDSLERAEICT